MYKILGGICLCLCFVLCILIVCGIKKELNNSVSLAKIMELLIYDIPELLIPAILELAVLEYHKLIVP